MVTRTRERDDRAPTHVSERNDQYDASGILINSTTNSYTSGDMLDNKFTGQKVSMTDAVIPGFRRLSRKGYVFVNPLYIAEVQRTCTDDSLVLRSPKNWTAGNGRTDSTRYGGPWEYASKFLTGQVMTLRPDLEDLAITQALGNVASPDALSLVTLAELGKTRDLIAHSLTSLYNGALAIGKGKGKQVVIDAFKGNGRNLVSNERISGKVFNTLSQKWLEYRYGWMPLYFDIRDHVKALTSLRPTRRTARGTAADDFSSMTVYPNVSIYNLVADLRRQRRGNINVRASILYEEANDIRKTINRFGLLALPSVAWELVPFSFVADWFVNLSDCMKALSPSLGVKYLACSVTTEINESCLTNTENSTLTNADILSGDIGVETMRWRVKERHIFVPRVRPRITVHLNWKRAIDAVALINGVFGGLNLRV